MKLTFLGAAKEVTGSCFLVEDAATRFLVDCGMFQGGSEADARNLAAVTPELTSADFVLLTHAHIDHSGLLPRLAHLGFEGPIYTTSATADLLEVMLVDSAHIQEKESHYEHAVEPLYTLGHALSCLRQLRRVQYDEEVRPAAGVRCVFRDAGHILGSAIIEVWVETLSGESKIVFSGDLGQYGRPLVKDPTPIRAANFLLVESTYGNRLHRTLDATIEELTQAVGDTLTGRRGNVIIPAFAVGRTQEVLYLLIKLFREGRLPHMNIFVDSPLAAKATALTLKHWRLLDPDVAALFESAMKDGKGPRIQFTETPEESAALSRIRHGAVIIAGSGMCEAGRIKYHLRDNLPRAESSVLIIGFQANGTRGRKLVDGVRSVRIFGDEVAVRARVHTIGGLSAHADQGALLQWLGNFATPPAQTFVVHGEAETAEGFARLVQERLGWAARAPDSGTVIEL
jgi:metallo-beta-lactamase family protein